ADRSRPAPERGPRDQQRDPVRREGVARRRDAGRRQRQRGLARTRHRRPQLRAERDRRAGQAGSRRAADQLSPGAGGGTMTTTDPPDHTPRLSPWWRHATIIVVIGGFSVLATVTALTCTNAPPIPKRVTDPSGQTLFDEAAILHGQEVFLKRGLMEH